MSKDDLVLLHRAARLGGVITIDIQKTDQSDLQRIGQLAALGLFEARRSPNPVDQVRFELTRKGRECLEWHSLGDRLDRLVASALPPARSAQGN